MPELKDKVGTEVLVKALRPLPDPRGDPGESDQADSGRAAAVEPHIQLRWRQVPWPRTVHHRTVWLFVPGPRRTRTLRYGTRTASEPDSSKRQVHDPHTPERRFNLLSAGRRSAPPSRIRRGTGPQKSPSRAVWRLNDAIVSTTSTGRIRKRKQNREVIFRPILIALRVGLVFRLIAAIARSISPRPHSDRPSTSTSDPRSYWEAVPGRRRRGAAGCAPRCSPCLPAEVFPPSILIDCGRTGRSWRREGCRRTRRNAAPLHGPR